uniref:Uncharacterized protein n=1 Tax=Trichuris muris TaxID=70415 RepID=A0A5S6QBR5_TRIMR
MKGPCAHVTNYIAPFIATRTRRLGILTFATSIVQDCIIQDIGPSGFRCNVDELQYDTDRIFATKSVCSIFCRNATTPGTFQRGRFFQGFVFIELIGWLKYKHGESLHSAEPQRSPSDQPRYLEAYSTVVGRVSELFPYQPTPEEAHCPSVEPSLCEAEGLSLKAKAEGEPKAQTSLKTA